MHSIKHLARATGIATAVLLCAPSFALSTFSLSVLESAARTGVPSVNEFNSNPATPMVRSITDSPYGSASSYGEAAFGVLKASATAEANGLPYGRFFARSGAGFSDDLTFSSVGLSGSSGFMNATLVFQRTLSVEGNPVDSYASATLHAGTNLWAYDYSETYMLEPGSCNPYSQSGCALALTSQTGNGADSATWLDGVRVSLKVPITFNAVDSFSVSIDMDALATFYSPDGVADGHAKWMADAAHSLYWGGISSVTDANGNAVDFTLSAASGTNYLQSFVPITAAVPEPETYALMLAGLGALGLLRRRQSRVVSA